MTITIQIASHPSNSYTPPGPAPNSPQQLLNGLGREYACTDNGIVQESVPESDLEYLTPHRNGFLRTILDAYGGHHHVVLRLVLYPVPRSPDLCIDVGTLGQMTFG